MKKDKKNYLDYIPVKNPALPWSQDDEGIVTVEVEHRGIAAKVAQVAFNRPKVSHVKLDQFGSFIWQQVDGERNIYLIGEEVKSRFGKEAEPLYERLITFFRILVENKYVAYRK
ncbi:MAG: PqqD family protein [Clostridia bacterium]|nr:PqqD family protein [Clostridia bacterium]NCC44433.1 PqqD family protein [Clostridia bacterium]